MTRTVALLAVPALFIAALAFSAHATISGSGGSVAFVATGPAGLAITGRSSAVSAAEEGANVLVTVPLANLDTGIGLRNSHMRDKYLETGKYPNAVLSVAKAAVGLPNGGAGDAAGSLLLHGVQRPVTVHYVVKKEGDGYAVSGTLRIDMTQFGIEQPSFAGVTVKPNVDVSVSFHAKDL